MKLRRILIIAVAFIAWGGSMAIAQDNVSKITGYKSSEVPELYDLDHST